MRFISSNVEPTGACATVGDLATPMSMMPGTSVNEPRGGEGAAREVDGERAPKVKVALAFRACEVEGERPSLGRVQRRQALGQLLGHKRLHVRLPSGPRRTPRIFAPRAKPRRAPWHLDFAPLQCRAAETPPETDVDASNPRPGAAAGSLSRGQSARSCRARLKKVRKRSNSTTSAEQSGVHTTTDGPRNGERDGRRRVQGTLRPHAPPGRASGGRP